MPIHDWTRVIAGTFHDFHLEWISSLKRALNSGVLPSGYYAMAEQRAIGLIPDVLALERHPAGNGSPTGYSAPSGGTDGVALATAPPRVSVTDESEADPFNSRNRRITIREDDADQVVAIIEIVSPGNKASSYAIQTIVAKAWDFLNAGIHLMVLDLFPPTSRDLRGIHGAIWADVTGREFHLPAGKSLTMASYAAGPVNRAFVELLAVGDTLPVMPLFLRPETYVPLPLEPTYLAAFEGVPQRWRAELESPPGGQ